MRHHRLSLAWGAAFLALAIVPAIAAAEPASDAPSPADRPLPLEPKCVRGETDEDRIAAAALFAHGRMLQDRDDLAGALARYQRAWRYDPRQTPLLREIAQLAFDLKRTDEAARYAVLAAEFDPQDPVLLRRLAQYLTEQRDWRRAVNLYEKSLALDKPPADEPLNASAATVQFEMGRLYFLIDDYAHSAERFARVRDALADPKSPLSPESKDLLLGKPAQTYGLWGEAFLAAGRHDEAKAMFEKSDAAKEDKPNLAFNLARVASARGNADEALARLDEYFAAKTSAAGIEPYDLLAKTLAKKTDDKAAAARQSIERLEKLHLEQPDNNSLALALAGQYFEAQRLDDAARLYAAALAIKPSGEAFRRLVEVSRKQSKYEALLSVAAQVVKETGSVAVLGDEGDSLIADAAAVKKVIEAAQVKLADKANPPPVELVEAAALLAIGGKEFAAGEDLFTAALAITGAEPPKLLESWGLALLQASQFERAAKVFRRMLEEGKVPTGEASLQFYLAGALTMLGKTDDALTAARRATALDPDNSRFAARIGWVLYHGKRLDAARQAQLETLQRNDKRHDDAPRRVAREARLALSNIDLERGDFPVAVEWLQQVLDEFPEDIQASNDLGYLWADRGVHLARAHALIERAVAAEPENLAYRDSLGWVLFRLGRYAEAEKELAKAAKTDDPDGVILDHWGDALAKAGRPADAQAAWQRAAKVFQSAGETGKLKLVEQKLAK